MALDLYERLVANDQTLVKFDFNIYRFNGEQIEKSFQSLEKNTSSEKISVLGLNLCPDDIASDIAEALQKHPKLAKVRLDEIPSQTFALFACAISNNDRLSHLQISGGGTVKGHEMRRLHGVGSLWSPCEESKPQRTLLSPSCRHSRDDQGDSSFPSNQSSAGNHLFRSVSFDDLDATELPSAVMTIVQAAHGHQSLRKFAFDMRDVFIIEEDDDIKSDFVSKIAGMIHGTPSLRSLCSCLMAALLDQTHFSLSWKVCEGNHIDPDGISAFMNALATNTSSKYLGLRFKENLVKIVEAKKTLRCLSVPIPPHNNTVGKERPENAPAPLNRITNGIEGMSILETSLVAHGDESLLLSPLSNDSLE